ncbi:x globin isoform X1 [Phycodurus eques]|uniref:x globin isoform X1 n=1 Tax=Phycodurus eques TaxID=693459 RepID=UPI002ACD23C3|nr:x globin isoform X1 [Phycodurus eques]
MGCAISGLAESAGLAEKIVRDHDAGGRGGGQHPNQDQIDMIKESWKVIRDDIAKVGIIVFVRLFETHPECKDVFFLFRDVKDLERLRTSRELRAHGLRVMSFIEKSVARLDQLERLQALAVELGKSHYHYSAPPKYYDDHGALEPVPADFRQKADYTLNWLPVSRRAHIDPDNYSHPHSHCHGVGTEPTLPAPKSVCRSRIHQCRAANLEGQMDR